jgi:hypothetical protein
MKKLILTTLAVAGVSSLAFAQGYVNWNGSPGAFVVAQTNSVNYSSLSTTLGGGAATGQATGGQGNTCSTSVYYYELLYSTVDTTTPTTLTDLTANWTATGFLTVNSTIANNGRLGTPLAPTTADEILAYPSATAPSWSFMLVGWSSNLGTTWAGAGNVESELENWQTAGSSIVGASYFGESYVGQTALSTSSTAGTTVFAASQTPGGLISNPTGSPLVLSELAATPEPATFALAALGGASLLLFRRRK